MFTVTHKHTAAERLLYNADNVVIGGGVALPLTLSLTVGIVGLTLRGEGGGGVRLLGQFFGKKIC